METKFESRIGKVAAPEKRIYELITDFRNFNQFIPAGKVEDFEASGEQCQFSVSGIGKVILQIVEKTPYQTVKVSGSGMANQQFFFWVQLKQVSDEDTRVKLTIKADVNPMLKMMVSKPLQGFLDKLMDAIENYRF